MELQANIGKKKKQLMIQYRTVDVLFRYLP